MSTSIPSTSSMDLMRLIDDTNCAAAVLETELWTVRGWLNGIAMFHKNNCRCCNNYVAHAIHTCKEQSVDLPMQDVSDAITTVWPKLMRDLESEGSSSALADYKALADEAASLKAALKMSQTMLTSKHNRIEQWDETIHNLKDEITALKCPQSMVSTTTSSM
jgi:TT viral ORF2-like